MSQIEIRPFESKDLRKAANVISRASLPHWRKQGITEKTIQTELIKSRYKKLADKVSGNQFFVAEDFQHRKIVGVIGLRNHEGSDIPNRLSTFYVDPKYQGMGIARLLYTTIKELAIQSGVETLYVSSSPFAEPIYAHFGFKKVRVEWKEYNDGGKTYNVWMEQPLTK